MSIIFSFVLVVFFNSALLCDQSIEHKLKEYQQNPYLGYLDATFWPEWEFLFGSWGGIRDKLRQKGIYVGASYAAEMMGNPVGGEHRGFAYCSSIGLNLNFNLDKLMHIKNTDFFTSFVWRFGTNLTTRKIHNQFDVAQLYGNETVLINEFYLRRTFEQNKLSLKAGRLNAANDFLNSGVFGRFVNNAFCGNPVSIFFNGFFSAYPIATWGAIADMNLTNKAELKIGVYNVEPTIHENKYHGFYWSLTNGSGPQVISQFTYKTKFTAQEGSLEGLYRAGVYYTQENKDVFLGGVHQGNYSGYLLAEQELYRDNTKENRNLVGFVSLIFAPKEFDEFPFFFDAGFVYEGLLKSRPYDATCIGIARGNYSSDLRKGQKINNEAQQLAETVLELNHWFYVSKYCFITPDMQYIIRPKGLDSIPNAYVLGVQIALIF